MSNDSPIEPAIRESSQIADDTITRSMPEKGDISSTAEKSAVGESNTRFWNRNMKRQGLLNWAIWQLDKRLFRWDHLPALASLPFVQKSYILLLLIPAIDHLFSPIIHNSAPVQISSNFHWQYEKGDEKGTIDAGLLTEGKPIVFQLSLPFRWFWIYWIVFCMGIGASIYAMWCPVLIGRDPSGRNATPQLILQNFREVALKLFTADRQNHFVCDFLKQYTTNWKTFQSISEDEKQKARRAGQELMDIPNLEADDKPKPLSRLNRHTVYYVAQHWQLHETQKKLNDALENLRWFVNEMRAPFRWLCGISFLIAISIFFCLSVVGFRQMIHSIMRG